MLTTRLLGQERAGVVGMVQIAAHAPASLTHAALALRRA